MATMTINVGGVTSAAKTIAPGDVTRLQAAMKTKFNLPGGATTQQIIDAIAVWLFNELVTETLQAERTSAAKTASDGVVTIPLT